MASSELIAFALALRQIQPMTLAIGAEVEVGAGVFDGAVFDSAVFDAGETAYVVAVPLAIQQRVDLPYER